MDSFKILYCDCEAGYFLFVAREVEKKSTQSSKKFSGYLGIQYETKLSH